jgi:hypothetical protein
MHKKWRHKGNVAWLRSAEAYLEYTLAGLKLPGWPSAPSGQQSDARTSPSACPDDSTGASGQHRSGNGACPAGTAATSAASSASTSPPLHGRPHMHCTASLDAVRTNIRLCLTAMRHERVSHRAFHNCRLLMGRSIASKMAVVPWPGLQRSRNSCMQSIAMGGQAHFNQHQPPATAPEQQEYIIGRDRAWHESHDPRDLDLPPAILDAVLLDLHLSHLHRLQAAVLPIFLSDPCKHVIAHASFTCGKTTCSALAMLSR